MSSTDSSSSHSSSALDILVCPAASDKEVERWGIFCATRGFVHRPGPTDRFYRKYQNDPTHRLEWVIIAYQNNPDTVIESKPIIGSVRLFDRVVYVPNSNSNTSSSPIGILGWGEVCTEPNLRGKGIANKVLLYAITIMEQYHHHNPDYKLSLLHAATTVMPLYEKFGFRSIQIKHGSLKLLASLTNQSIVLPLTNDTMEHIPLFSSVDKEIHKDRKLTVRLAEIPSQSSQSSSTLPRWDDVPDLMEIYRDTHETLLASTWKTGMIERTEEYWRSWIPFAARGHLWVLEEEITTEPSSASLSVPTTTRTKRLIGYACAHWRNDTLRLMDIGFRSVSVTTDNYQRQKDMIYLLEKAYIYGWGPERYVAAAAVQAAALLSSSVTPSVSVTIPSVSSTDKQYLSSTDLIIPCPILSWFSPLFINVSSANFIPDLPHEIDPGWMVRSLGVDSKDQSITDTLIRSGIDGTFCILGLDGF